MSVGFHDQAAFAPRTLVTALLDGHEAVDGSGVEDIIPAAEEHYRYIHTMSHAFAIELPPVIIVVRVLPAQR